MNTEDNIKKQEKQLLKKLIEMDGFFAEAVCARGGNAKGILEVMNANIDHDDELFHCTCLDETKKLAEYKKKVREMEKSLDEYKNDYYTLEKKVDDLEESIKKHMALNAALIEENETLRCRMFEFRKQVITERFQAGLPLDANDINFLISNLK